MLTSLSLFGFRGIDERRFDFGEISSIVGPNGSGKSHILEAIHTLGGGKVLIPHDRGETGYRIEGMFGESGMEKQYILLKEEKREQYTIQGSKLSKKKYLREIPYISVYIGPFEMNLLYFTPSVRREYIDSILERAFEQFGIVEREYAQVLKQRNALLKKVRENEANKEDLEFWDKKIAHLGSIYHIYRKKYILTINDSLGKIADTYQIRCHYGTSIPEDEDTEVYICKYLQENRERDIFSGHTHIGPHRDDIRFMIEYNGSELDAAFFLSRGEMKLLLMELKQIELQFFEKHLTKKVILLIDDLFAELDDPNTQKIFDRFHAEQTIITSQKPISKNISEKEITQIQL